MPEYFEDVKVPIKVNACIGCGSTDIELWDCGYSSFNPGGGRCRSCKREVRDMTSPMVTKKELASIWNRENDIDKRLDQIRAEILNLESERRKLLNIKQGI